MLAGPVKALKAVLSHNKAAMIPQILLEQGKDTFETLKGYLEEAEKIQKAYKKACETEVALPEFDIDLGNIQKECKEACKLSSSLNKMICATCFHLELLYSCS